MPKTQPGPIWSEKLSGAVGKAVLDAIMTDTAAKGTGNNNKKRARQSESSEDGDEEDKEETEDTEDDTDETVDETGNESVRSRPSPTPSTTRRMWD